MKKDKKMNNQATKTRNVLATLLVIVIIGSGVGFYYGLQIIRSYALEVTHAVADSQASGESIEELSQLKKQLTEGQGLVEKANALFSTPSDYQTQALKDISKYASRSGISVTSIDSAKPAAPANGAPVTGGDNSITVSIKSPVSYKKLLQFLDLIEGNLPKMQITGVTISRPTVVSGDLVNTDKITLTVSTR